MICSIYEVILLLVLSGLLGLCCGLFSYFLDYCFWPNSIFKWYLPWLAMMALKKRGGTGYQAAMKEKDTGGNWQEIATTQAENLFLFKILGGCSVCFNVWIAMISWSVICITTFIPWYYGFTYLIVSSWLIRKLVGATY